MSFKQNICLPLFIELLLSLAFSLPRFVPRIGNFFRSGPAVDPGIACCDKRSAEDASGIRDAGMG